MIAAGLVITVMAGLAILTIGVLYLTVPLQVARGFGLREVPPAAYAPWLHVKGVRDVVSGIVAIVLVAAAPRDLTGWLLLCFALIPLGDAATVLRAHGNARAALAVHGSTAALMVVGALLLLLG